MRHLLLLGLIKICDVSTAANTCKMEDLPSDYPTPSVQTEALIIAARKGDLKMAHQLQKGGAVLDERNEDGEDALMVAARRGRFSFARFLVRAGVGMEGKDRLGRTALMHAVMSDEATTVDVLIDLGASTSVSDIDNCTPLLLAAKMNSTDALEVLLSQEDVIPTILSNKDSHGMTALHYTSRTANFDATQLLLDASGASGISVGDNYDRTPLMLASGVGADRIVNLFLKLHKGILQYDADFRTALMYAVLDRHNEVALMLLNAGSIVGMKDAEGRTAVMMAAVTCNVELFLVLLEASEGSGEATVWGVDTAQRSIVHLLAEEGCITLLRVLKKQRHIVFKSFLNEKDAGGVTPLMAASAKGRVKTVLFLHREEADVTVRNVAGETAYDVAVGAKMLKTAEAIKAL